LIHDAERATVKAAAREFWDEVASGSETKAKIVQILKDCNAAVNKAGRAYHYT